MGADAVMVFYGLRWETTDSESGSLSDESDSRIMLATEHGLDHWWGTFSIDYQNEKDYLFVGKMICRIGHEDSYAALLDSVELDGITSDCSAKLAAAGLSDSPRLYIQLEPDC